MKQTETTFTHQPVINKYLETVNTGIHSQLLSRYAIGYLVRGVKRVYNGDKCQTIRKGEVFYFGLGYHHVENIPENGQPFEQILFFYTPEDIQRILLHLNITYGLKIAADDSTAAASVSYLVTEAGGALRNFFQNIVSMRADSGAERDLTEEQLKMTELIYLILSQENSPLRSAILSNVDTEKKHFEQVIYEHIFRDISIEELSRLTNRSLTSFKKEFRRHFEFPPHKWFIRQCLMHSRLLLISTSKSISEIGNECSFPNTSHFIKLFKKAYDLTPAAYRSRHLKSEDAKSRVGNIQISTIV